MLKFKPLLFQRNDEGEKSFILANEMIAGKRMVYQLNKTENGKFVVMHEGYYNVYHDTEEDAITFAQKIHQEKMNKWFKSCEKQMIGIHNHLKSIEFKELEFNVYNPIQEPGAEPSGTEIYVARQNLPGCRQVTYYISSLDDNGKCSMMVIDTANCCPTKYGFTSIEDAKDEANSINSKLLMEAYNDMMASMKFIHQFFKED